MIDNLKEVIAHQLMKSTIGLTLAELANSMPPEDYDNDRDRISARLNSLKVNNFVEKSASFNTSPVRWKITPRGRAAFSQIYDEKSPETPTKTYPLSVLTDDSLQPEPVAAESLKTADACPPVVAQNTQASESQHQPIKNDEMARAALTQAGYIVLDPFSENDAFFCSVVERLSNSNKPRITRKPEKLATLRLVRESLGILNSDIDELLAAIITDFEKLAETPCK